MAGDPVSRAFSAWFRDNGDIEAFPSKETSGIHTVAGKDYVILATEDDEILKVYRIENSGRLKGLRRWPKELGDEFEYGDDKLERLMSDALGITMAEFVAELSQLANAV